MSKLITHIKRLALTLCLATPIVSWAADPYTTKGYEDFGNTAGVVLWRGPGDTSGTPTFHNATVIDVAADGTEGDAYTMTADDGQQSWKRFSNGTTPYSAPGKLLVYDEAGYGNSADAQFGNFVFGGLWVKTLAADNTPYALVGAGYVRTTYLGADDYPTLFKIEKSYTINRDKAATVRGTANVEISEGATFSIHKGYSQTVSVPSGAKLVLSGEGTLAVSTLSVAGTLDVSADTVPTIDGNVTLAGNATIIVPAGTALNETISLEVCSGTLSAAGVVYVKVGSAEPEEAELTISGGTITEITTGIQTEQTFTSDYPSEVPFGFTYTFEATEAVTIPAVTVNGTLKTSGPITITDLEIANGANLEVVAGNTTVGCSADCKLKGNITVDVGATLTNTRTDSLSYNHSMTVDIYGTLAMGATRWSVPAGCTFNLRAGAQVTGTGDGWASLDFINGVDRGLDVYGSATIEGKMRVRANETRIWIAENSTLVLSSGIADGGGHHAGFKQVGPGTLEIHANSTGLSGNASVMTQGTLRLVDTTLAFPVSLQGNSSYLEVVATEEATTVPVNVTSIANNNVTFSGAGKVNGSITKTSAPSGNLATALQSAAWTGTFVADWAGANDQRFDINSFGNANSVVKVTKLAGGYIHDKSTTYFNVIPTVDVSGTMTLNNGYSNYVTVFSKLTGSGTVTINTFPVTITTLDKFTGTFNSNANDAIEIGTINLAATPAPGAKIVSIGSSGRFYGLASTKVAVEGVVDDSFTGKLEKKSDGIYVAVPVTTVDITVTPVAGATASVTADGQSVEIVDGKVTVDIGAEVSVTYTATAGYVVTDGTVVFTATADTTAVDTSSVKSDAIVAVITDAHSDTWSYTDIATAFDEVEDGDTLTLVGAAVTLASDITVETSYTLAGDAEGTTVTGAGKIYLTGSAELTLDATLTSVGNQFWFSSKDAKLTFPTEGFTPNVRPYTAGGCQTGTTVNGDGTTTYYQYLFLTLQVGASNVTLAYDVSGDSVVTKQVYEGDELVFTATPAEGYENVVVTVNGETLAPVEGKYTVVVGTANVVLQATATAMPVITIEDTENGSVTVKQGEVTIDSGDCVASGTTVTVIITPAEGYKDDEIVITMGEVDITESVGEAEGTFEVTGNVNISVVFVRDVVTFTVQKPEGTTVTVYTGDVEVPANQNGSYTVDAGAQVSVEWTVGDDYKISGTTTTPSALVNDGDVISTPEGMTVAKVKARISGDDTKYTSVIEAISQVIYQYKPEAQPGTVVMVLDPDWEHTTEYAAELDATWTWDPVERTYTYKTFVARVMTAKYESLAEAIDAAEAGQTVVLIADDRVSFANVEVEAGVPSNGSIVIDKNITIDGAGFKVYGNSNAGILNATGSATPGYDMVADLVDGTNLMGFFVKSGNVTFTNITLTEFGDTAYVNKFGYTPIQTASAYEGTLTLNGVNFSKFNRTAVCVRGGTLSMTGGTVTANATHKNPNDHCQQPIEVRGGTATISGVTVASDFAYANNYGAIVAWGSATLNNVVVDFTGYGVWSDGPAVAITGENTSIEATVNALFAEEGGTISVSAGDFTGPLAVDSDPNSAISLTGGTYDRDVDGFCATGYKATKSSSEPYTWTVAEVQEVPVTPGAQTDPVDTYAEAAEQAAKAVVSVPTDVATAEGMTDEKIDDYKDLFVAKVIEVKDGETIKYAVAFELKDDVAEAIQAEVDAEAEDFAEAAADAAADAVNGGEATVTTVPGLYYVVEAGSDVDGITPASCTLATGSTLDLTLPNKGTKGFYKLRVSVTPVDVQE